MNCVIIDDDELTLATLKKYIDKTEGLELAAEFMDPVEASKYLKSNEVDFAFLDVEMPEMTGLEMLKYFDLPQVILISHNKGYAAEGFDYNVTDFLSKPIDYGRFLKGVEKIENINESVKKSPDEENTFFIKDGTRFIKLNINEIVYIEALGDYIKIFTENEKHTIISTMKNMEKKLSEYNFIRIHRAYIVNLNFVKEFEENAVVVDGKSLTVSRFYKPDFLKKLKTF